MTHNETIPSFYDHIVFYEIILEINYSYSQKLAEGEQIILFLEFGKPTYICFDTPHEEFNIEIKFLGKANINEYNVNVNICNEEEIFLNNDNKLIRRKLNNINSDTKITLINSRKVLTGVIIKRALTKINQINVISNSLQNYTNTDKNLTLVKFEKGLKNLHYFYNKI